MNSIIIRLSISQDLYSFLPISNYIVQQVQELSFDHIDMLQQFNINATDITKLRNGGISTVMAVLQVTRRQLLKIKAFLVNILLQSVLILV